MEKEIELYYDHYKDSFTYLRKYLNLRDRYFLIGLICIIVLFFQVYTPELSSMISETLIKNKIGQEIYIDFNILNTVFVIFFLSVLNKYFQTNLYIERQYDYIHKIEKNLTQKLTQFDITREGESYVSNYPIVLSIIHRIYTIFFPVLLIIGLIVKWISEYKIYKDGGKLGFLIINSTVLTMIFGLTIFYLVWIHFGDFKSKLKP
jgi:hypothetical protein